MSYNPVPSLNNGNATFNNDVNVSGVSRFNAGVKTKLNTEADGATITFDMNESSSHTAELGGNRTLDVSNVDAGQKFSLRLKQDATGNHTVNWWNNISWMSVDGSEPTLRTSGVDYFGFICTSGGYYEGFHLTEASTGGGGGSSYDDTYISGVATFASGLATQNQADIITISGLLYDDTAISGYFESRVDSADSAITANSGYFESRVDQNAADIVTVSGLTGGGSYTAGSGLTLVGTEFNVYGGSGNFEYLEIQTDNTLIPTIKFTGSGVTDTPISLEVASSFESATGSGSALLFQGKQGQLFSITDNLSSGTIFSVSDITGLPMLEIDASGHVQIGEFADDITIHKPILLSGGIPTSTTNKLYNNAGTLYFNGSALGGGLPYSSGDYYLQEIRSNSASGVSISGALQPQITQNASDIATVSGLLYDDTAISGYFESRVGVADADLSYISGIAVYASGLDNYLLNPVGIDGISITSTPESVIFSGDATLARVTDINAVSGVATSQTLQSITDNGSTTNNAITINNDLTAEFIFAELDGPIVFECKNSTGAQIDAGTPVYVSGHFGTNGKALIAPARSDDSTKMPAIGVLEEDLIHDAEGHVNSFGRIQNIDTSSFTVGNTVYVAPSGGLTNVRPTGIGELVQNMGKVLRSDASQGRILLLGPGRSNDVPNSGEFKELTVDGHFSAVTKSFLIDHPSKEGAKLQYASLEGPENGVYVRGTTKETFITLPNYWRDLVHNSSITVTLTSVGSFQPLFVESKSNREIIVGGVCGYYDYVVYGERKDVAKLEVEW